MRSLLLTNFEKSCNYLIMKKSLASYPNKDEYSLGDKAPSSKSPSNNIVVCSQ